MTKIILTESQLKKIVKVIREQEESVFKLTDVDGDLGDVGNGTLEFTLYLIGEDNEGNDMSKTIELSIDFTVGDSEESSYDSPGYGGELDWEITSATQVDPEEKELDSDDIMSLSKNSMVVNFLQKKLDLVMEDYDESDYDETDYDPNKD